MPRYIVQNLNTGKFLAPDEDGQPEWYSHLHQCGGGVMSDYEQLAEMAYEYAEIGEQVMIINLDTFGRVMQ